MTIVDNAQRIQLAETQEREERTPHLQQIQKARTLATFAFSGPSQGAEMV